MSRKKNENGEHESGSLAEPVVKESKTERFRRLANRRLPKAIKVIGYLQTLANTNQYEFTEAQAQIVVSKLTDAVSAVKSAFAGKIAAPVGDIF